MVWLVVIAVMLGTAVFVPSRIVYKKNQSVVAAPGNVVIMNFAFTPDVLKVPAGTKVTFTNNDGAAHTVTAADKSFDSGDLQQGDTFAVKVSKSGSYFCDIHDYMTAKIQVSG